MTLTVYRKKLFNLIAGPSLQVLRSLTPGPNLTTTHHWAKRRRQDLVSSWRERIGMSLTLRMILMGTDLLAAEIWLSQKCLTKTKTADLILLKGIRPSKQSQTISLRTNLYGASNNMEVYPLTGYYRKEGKLFKMMTSLFWETLILNIRWVMYPEDTSTKKRCY